MCRWCLDDLIVDIMPTRGEILGFSAEWYPLAYETATPHALPDGKVIRLVTPACLLIYRTDVTRTVVINAVNGRHVGRLDFKHKLKSSNVALTGSESANVERMMASCNLTPKTSSRP